jgi:CheY-like chemotaxis protein
MKAKTATNPRGLRILIAEDEKNISDLLVELLSQEDREIVIVHNGMDAVRKLRETPYDLLITDLMMPELDGMEVLHQAKKLYPQILVIIITGYASLETAIQAVKEGAYDYLRKPFRLDELKISVDNACERIQLMRENQLLLSHLKRTSTEPEGADETESGEQESPTSAGPNYYSHDWLPPTYFQTETLTASASLSELERLGNLLQQGLISDDEFKTLKRKLLDRVG